MAVRSLPLEIELVIYAGTTFRREFRWLPDGGPAQDFTQWAATMLIGPSRGTALAALTTDNGGVTLTGTGQILITMPPAATKAIANGQYTYVLDLTDATGFVMRFMRGRISVVHDVEAATP